MNDDNETIRWPTNLDRRAIEQRLLRVAQMCESLRLPEVGRRFIDVPAMSPAQIATNVVASITWLFNQPEERRAGFEAVTKELEMVALNLKNLK